MFYALDGFVQPARDVFCLLVRDWTSGERSDWRAGERGGGRTAGLTLRRSRERQVCDDSGIADREYIGIGLAAAHDDLAVCVCNDAVGPCQCRRHMTAAEASTPELVRRAATDLRGLGGKRGRRTRTRWSSRPSSPRRSTAPTGSARDPCSRRAGRTELQSDFRRSGTREGQQTHLRLALSQTSCPNRACLSHRDRQEPGPNTPFQRVRHDAGSGC